MFSPAVQERLVLLSAVLARALVGLSSYSGVRRVGVLGQGLEGHRGRTVGRTARRSPGSAARPLRRRQ